MAHLDDTARSELIVSHLGFAGAFAKCFRGRGVTYEDLAQECKVGLCEAAQRYDPDVHSTRFTTFASFWMRSRCVAAIEEQRRMPPLVDFRADSLIGDDTTPDLDERTVERLWSRHRTAAQTRSTDLDPPLRARRAPAVDAG